jgi:hypothetical protein
VRSPSLSRLRSSSELHGTKRPTGEKSAESARQRPRWLCGWTAKGWISSASSALSASPEQSSHPTHRRNASNIRKEANRRTQRGDTLHSELT